jgi:hypothetical protein
VLLGRDAVTVRSACGETLGNREKIASIRREETR